MPKFFHVKDFKFRFWKFLNIEKFFIAQKIERVKELPSLNEKEQERLMKEAVLEYFSGD